MIEQYCYFTDQSCSIMLIVTELLTGLLNQHYPVIACDILHMRHSIIVSDKLESDATAVRPRSHVCVFKSTPFSKVSAFSHDNAAFSKVSTFKPVFDGRRKRTEKSPFSHENVYVWTWPKSRCGRYFCSPTYRLQPWRLHVGREMTTNGRGEERISDSVSCSDVAINPVPTRYMYTGPDNARLCPANSNHSRRVTFIKILV